MRRVLLASVLLHAGAAVVLVLPRATLPPPALEEPARMEVIFGANGATPSPPAGSPATIVELPGDGERATAVPLPLVRLASADPGLRVDRPDASMIPAREDPGNRAPDYPRFAKLLREQGTVLVRLHIDPIGRVARLEKLASSGYASLDDAAVAALARWHFLPALRAGEPVASYRDQPVRFEIQ